MKTNNLQDLVNQPYIETNNSQITPNIHINEEKNLMQTNINQEQNIIQINIVQEQSEIQQEQNNQINNQSKIKLKISVKFIPDPGAQTSKSPNNPVKLTNTFSQPTA